MGLKSLTETFEESEFKDLKAVKRDGESWHDVIVAAFDALDRERSGNPAKQGEGATVGAESGDSEVDE